MRKTTTEGEEPLVGVEPPRPILIEFIEILDPDLRSRCLDLFNYFKITGQRDRHDTVLPEATRILENKLRIIYGAPEKVIGVDLAQCTFGGSEPKLLVSDVQSEQEAAHHLSGSFPNYP